MEREKIQKIDYIEPIESVDERDIPSILEEYKNIKQDSRGNLYTIENGIKKRIIIPYIPAPNDNSTIRLLFKKRRGAENLPFEFDMLDNNEIVLAELYEKRPIWVKEPDQKALYGKNKDNIDRYVERDTYYTRLKSASMFKNDIGVVFSKTHIKLHQYVMSRYFPLDMKEYHQKNKEKQQIDKYNKLVEEYNKSHSEDKKKEYKAVTKQIEIDHFNNNQADNRLRNLHICFNNENNIKKIIDKNIDLNNFFIVYEKERGKYTGKKFYCVVAFLENQVLTDRTETTELIIIRETDTKRILGRANIVCFAFENFYDMAKIVENCSNSKKEGERNIATRTILKEIKGQKEKKQYKNDNEIVEDRNTDIAELMKEIYNRGLVSNEMVFAYADITTEGAEGQKEVTIADIMKREQIRAINLKGEKELTHKNANDLLYEIIENDILATFVSKHEPKKNNF